MFDELIIVQALRNISLFIDTLGILVGLDLIIGAPVISFLNNLLNKVIDFDKALSNPVKRVSLGIIFVVISGLMLSSVIMTK